MTFAAPWALLGLLSLPVLWWLHVRRKRPPLVDTPSLMFVLEEEEQRKLPRGRQFDWELVLTLATATWLTLAAAGPVWQRQRAQRVVRVVIAGGALATRTGYPERVDQTLDAIGEALGSGDVVHVRWVPPRDAQGEWRRAARPTLDRLFGEARAGEATVRYVISDKLPEEAPEDLGWIALGGPGENAGIVSARVVVEEDRRHLYVVVERTSLDVRVPSIVISGSEDAVTALPVSDRLVQTAKIPLSDGVSPDAELVATLQIAGADVLAADDEVSLRRAQVPVHVDPALPPDVRRALDAALDASEADVARVPHEQAQIVFGVRPRPARFVVDLTVPRRDVPPVALPEGDDLLSTSAFVRDLTLSGIDWTFPQMPPQVERETLLLGRVVNGRVWPVLVRAGDDAIRLLALPPPSDALFWPLFVENVLDAVAGEDAGGGFRIRGILDRTVTQLGRDQQPFHPAALRAVPPDRNASTVDLRTLCLVLAVLGLTLLWALPYVRRRRTTATPVAAS